jgi:hypothetical protein
MLFVLAVLDEIGMFRQENMSICIAKTASSTTTVGRGTRASIHYRLSPRIFCKEVKYFLYHAYVSHVNGQKSNIRWSLS